MKKLALIIIGLFIALTLHAQSITGKVVVDSIYSAALENKGGENPTRGVSVYLPPSYENSDERYPVIYFLHGFTLDNQTMFTWGKLEELLNKAINTGKIKPVILVVSDQKTLYRGSFYTNSTLTGNWADFTSQDLVKYMDENYRTIPNRESRGLAGHSMGGFGALKIAMQFPDVFANVYALSPAELGFANEVGSKSYAYRRIPKIESREQLIDGFNEFYPNALVASARAFSPNPDKPPFYADLPFEYDAEGNMTVNQAVLKKWQKEMPLYMLDEYAENLRKLNVLKLDWGRNEANLHISKTARAFSEKLENLGVPHYAEEYIGDHTNKISTEDGRILQEMLPFFDRYLIFNPNN